VDGFKYKKTIATEIMRFKVNKIFNNDFAPARKWFIDQKALRNKLKDRYNIREDKHIIKIILKNKKINLFFNDN